jgi:hypothetical protein
MYSEFKTRLITWWAISAWPYLTAFDIGAPPRGAAAAPADRAAFDVGALPPGAAATLGARAAFDVGGA